MIRYIILLVIVGFSGMFAQQNGILNVYSTPENCWVKVDDILIGKTPLTNLSLTEGDHSIQIFPPEQGIWNMETKLRTVTMIAGKSQTLAVEFDKPVYINSLPYGAELFTDSTLVGATPIYIPFYKNQGKSFRIEKAGYKSYAFVLNESNSVIANLEKSESFIAQETKKPQLLGLIPRQHVKSKFSLLAASVATHWLSFYFKNEADSNFDRYETASDPAKIDQYWNSTRKFDRLSDISLGVSYASLAGLIYMVVWK